MQAERTRPRGRDEYHAYLLTPEWKAKRQAALKRAGHRCQLCNRDKQLQVHHRTYERVGNEEPGDLTVLCNGCHEKFHGIDKTPPPREAVARALEGDTESAAGRDAILRRVTAVIAPMPASVLRAELTALVATRLQLSENLVDALVRSAKKRPKTRRSQPQMKKKGPSKQVSKKVREITEENDRLHRIQVRNRERQEAARAIFPNVFR